MKKIMLSIMTFLMVCSFMPSVILGKESKKASKEENAVTETVTEETKDNLVNVYVFEAGGCPFCIKEIEYLKGLAGYQKTFKITVKELYVDHVDWEKGSDYELGKKVATTFNEAGFEDAYYSKTPFVVISDLYAASGYSESLETYINDAVVEGDKDVVGCIAEGKENCLNIEVQKNYDPYIIIGIFVVVIGGLVALVITGKKD